jgi:predicted phosphodiesterase
VPAVSSQCLTDPGLSPREGDRGADAAVRIAVVSDIHGNLTALEAVVADLALASPDLVLHGGDLADGGASPAEVVDRIRDLGWAGVQGNTDEMLARPEALAEFEKGSASPGAIFEAVRAMAAWTRTRLGPLRVAWLQALPRSHLREDLALVHGSPESSWRAPGERASDEELAAVYAPLARPLVAYGHIHRPFVRTLPAFTVANAGSVGLPYDGDRRASYLLTEGREASIRRVEYAWEAERRALASSGLPHAAWVARMLEAAGPLMP